MASRSHQRQTFDSRSLSSAPNKKLYGTQKNKNKVTQRYNLTQPVLNSSSTSTANEPYHINTSTMNMEQPRVIDATNVVTVQVEPLGRVGPIMTAEGNRPPSNFSSSRNGGRGRRSNGGRSRSSHRRLRGIQLPVNLQKCRYRSIASMVLSVICPLLSFPTIFPATFFFALIDSVLTVIGGSITIYNYWETTIMKTHQLHHIFNLWIAALCFKIMAFLMVFIDMVIFIEPGITIPLALVLLMLLVPNLAINYFLIKSAKNVLIVLKPTERLYCVCSA